MLRSLYVLIPALGLAGAITAAQTSPAPGQPGQTTASRPQQPARDAPAQKNDVAPPPQGRMSGRVVAADTGRPVKRARVFITAPELPQGRGALTDENGLFDFMELPAGRYTLTASKSGFIGLSYGQRRPLQAGTPLQLADGQQLKGIEFHLPRGGVIGGHIVDEDGDPMPGVLVAVQRYQYLQGDRRLMPAGTAQTDDRGQYRVWGLNPGDYYVSAVARLGFGGGRGGGGRGGGGGGRGGAQGGAPGGQPGAPPGIANLLGGALPANLAALFGQGEDQDRLNYAPTYFPGVSSATEARPITLNVSQEIGDVDFSLQLIRTLRVAGHVLNGDGTPVSSGIVNLTAQGAAAGGRRAFGMNYASRIDWDGSFSIGNVAPGQYTVRARGTDDTRPQFAALPVTVAAGDLDDLSIVLRPGGAITGTVAFPPTQSPTDVTQVRISAPSSEAGDLGPNPNARVEKDGRFTLDGVPAGPHLIRPNGGNALRGWTLKSVTIDGRDVTDIPVEVKSGETIANVNVLFTDKLSEINGTVTDEQGMPITEFTVLAFSTDSSMWRAQSRHIMTARPDQTGKFRIRGLPPGEYYLTTVDPAEQGEWFEAAYLDQHRTGATRLTVGDGDIRTQDFRVRR